MKIVLDLTPEEILENSAGYDRRLLYEELENEFNIDIEESVDRATSLEKQRIFDSLLDEGYGNDLINEDDTPTTIEDKRYMMDKSDDDLLMNLIDKYKYFT